MLRFGVGKGKWTQPLSLSQWSSSKACKLVLPCTWLLIVTSCPVLQMQLVPSQLYLVFSSRVPLQCYTREATRLLCFLGCVLQCRYRSLVKMSWLVSWSVSVTLLHSKLIEFALLITWEIPSLSTSWHNDVLAGVWTATSSCLKIAFRKALGFVYRVYLW